MMTSKTSRDGQASVGVGSAAAVLLLTIAACSVGCGREAIVAVDTLPVRRVVVYRNGIAYFERNGHVDKSEIRFKMKQAEVGDFLATLAVMERGGSSVRAAAFPLKTADSDTADTADTEDDDEREDHQGQPPGESRQGPGSNQRETRGSRKTKEQLEDQKKGLETVVLSLDGREHDLQVGYVAESPVWRPSYRLVVRAAGEAELQAWGIVENLSGEDWKDVKLSLIAGAPLAFEAQLGTPVIPPRPTVTDEGEVIAAVPHGETSLQQEPPAAPKPAAPPPPAAVSKDEEETPDGEPSTQAQLTLKKGGGGARDAARRKVAPRPSSAPAPAPAGAGLSAMMRASGNAAHAAAAEAPAEPAAVSPPRNVRSLAAVAIEGGATRYDLPLPVTIPDESATMVMLLSRGVPGEAMFLFAPDAGVPDSASHPFRVARFTNGAGGTLERGPIAVFEQGAFLGQGMLDPLPAGATATVPFALERALAVDQDKKFDEAGARVAKIENSVLTLERDRVTQTKYRIRNGGDGPAKLLVKHPRISGARLFAPPKGTEDNVGTGSALVPTSVPARGTSELVVDERTTSRENIDWFNVIADVAVKAFLAEPRTPTDVSHKLSAAWSIRGDIVQKRDERDKLQQQTRTLAQSTDETRRNLKAIEKNATANALRQKLTARLSEASAQLDDFNRKTVELDAQLAELGVKFREAVRDIAYTAPPTSP